MKISDYDYDLPEQLIAQFPPKVRGQTRLLALNRQTGATQNRAYGDMFEYLSSGDVVILNNTKVIKARLLATNYRDQPRELLLTESHGKLEHNKARVIYRGSIKPGEILTVNENEIVVEEVLDGGLAIISSQADLYELAEQHGNVPLPPYMKRSATAEDQARYQTVFAQDAGSVAAPTASLNFTDELAGKLKAKGVKICYLTLHVGLGTFLPIRSDDVEDHIMHSEYFEIPAETIAAIQEAKHKGQKICAIGTTVARTLEFAHQQILNDSPQLVSGEANIFIYPGYKFQLVDVLLTNFHAPRSTVLMLTAALAGWKNLEQAYKTAVGDGYAFLSYGDSMLIY